MFAHVSVYGSIRVRDRVHVWSVWHLMATEHSGWHVRHWTRTHGINFLCQYLLLTLTRLQLAVTLQYICRQLRTLGDNGINGSFKNSLFLIERQIKLAIINLGMVSAALTFRRKSLYPCIPVSRWHLFEIRQIMWQRFEFCGCRSTQIAFFPFGIENVLFC